MQLHSCNTFGLAECETYMFNKNEAIGTTLHCIKTDTVTIQNGLGDQSKGLRRVWVEASKPNTKPVNHSAIICYKYRIISVLGFDFLDIFTTTSVFSVRLKEQQDLL